MAVSQQEFRAFCGPALARAKGKNVVDGSVYVNPELGFAIRVPEDWRITYAPTSTPVSGEDDEGNGFATISWITPPTYVPWIKPNFLSIRREKGRGKGQEIHFFVADFLMALDRMGILMHLRSGCDDPNCEFHRDGTVSIYDFQYDEEFMESLLLALPVDETESAIHGSKYRIAMWSFPFSNRATSAEIFVKTLICERTSKTLVVAQSRIEDRAALISDEDFVTALSQMRLLEIDA